MPRYEIEQYELHTMKFSVVARNKAQAIKKLLNGDAQVIDDTLEFIEVDDGRGMLVAENRKLAAALRALDVEVGEKVISSIRRIEEAD